MRLTKAIVTAVLVFTCLTSNAKSKTAKYVYNEKMLFDEGWVFTQNGKSQQVDLPHDWDIDAAPDAQTGKTGTGGGWYPGGKGEYRKTFKTPKAEIVKLQFDGVYQQAEVYINGLKIGQHGYGYTPFTVDVTPYLYKKGKNELVVKVDNSKQPNCRWYSGSGIYRHVWMLQMPAVHIAQNGIYVTTPKVSGKEATVRVEVEIENESDIRQTARVEIHEEVQMLELEAGQRRKAIFTFNVQNPHLWQPGDAGKYVSFVKLNGVLNKFEYGIRSIAFDAEKGFLLNGRPMKLNGACLHHDNGVLGAMAFDDAEKRKVQLMQNAGFNLIRTAHNPPSEAFLDACDQLGMLVIDEAFDGWRQSKTPYDYSTMIDSCYQEDIQAMVKRDRNHPCIIAWSLGNEVMERKDIGVITTARKLKAAVMECDNTRPITEALCAWDKDWEIYDPHAEVLDVVGYNYMIHKHKSDHQRDPKRVMWQTESYPRDAFRNWAVVNDHPYIVGDIVWTGLDYLGESGIGKYYYEGQEVAGEHYIPGGQPKWHGAYCGDVDITGWRKPISHYRHILWSDVDTRAHTTETLYMAVKEPNNYRGNIKQTSWSVWPTWESWTWPGWEGKPIEVEVYTKEQEVSLYLNEKLIERKKVDRSTEYKAVFTLPYQQGELHAEAGGKSVSLVTAGQPTSLSLESDDQHNNQINYNGQDLAFFTITVRDKNGNIVTNKDIACEVSIKGDGKLLAAASANMKDTEPATSAKVTTWNGRALVVVRTKKARKGNIIVEVNAPGLKTGICKVQSW